MPALGVHVLSKCTEPYYRIVMNIVCEAQKKK